MIETQELTVLEIELQTPDDEPYCEEDPLSKGLSLCGAYELMGPAIPNCECTNLCKECRQIKAKVR